LKSWTRVRQNFRKGKGGQTRSRRHPEKVISDHLDAQMFPIPDLLIPHQRRDAREQFSAMADSYAELVITRRCGPDFKKTAVFRRAGRIRKRNRRFGGI